MSIYHGIAVLVALLTVLLPGKASAGAFEYSLGFSFNRSNYTEESFSWNRRWGTSIGYHFTDRSGIEFSFQDVVDRTKIIGYEDTTFHDQIFSFNWVQALTGKDFPVQPYVKAGIGQLNREATGTYGGGGSPPRIVDSVTAVFSLGARIYLSRGMAIRTEATSYLSGGSIRTWKDNLAYNFGVSVFF